MNAKEKVKWGILGCAGIVERTFLPAIKKVSQAEVIAIASRDPKKARAWAEKFQLKKSYGSYEELLADPEIEAVYNPLPNHLHHPLTIQALRAGKHVLCEKPLALTSTQAREMFSEAGKNQRLLMEGFMYRFHPRLLKAKEILDAGLIGPPRFLRATFHFFLERQSENYRWYPQYGGGALYDLGCYTINAARLVFEAEPEEVLARAHMDDKTGVDLTTSLLCIFPGSRLALLSCSFELEFESSLEISGPGGQITLNRAFSAKDLETEIQIFRQNKTETIKFPPADQFQLMIEHFSSCVLRGERPLIDSRDSIGNMTVIELALRQVK
ncbi:MAG: Gfo/Idh/MocA family oxidoreductase [Candidatus Aminicenantes bacterium]|nr:Gfo/Idh/MocA family oxidoreductase [Candidatus Aminicenantes bacterium]